MYICIYENIFGLFPRMGKSSKNSGLFYLGQCNPLFKNKIIKIILVFYVALIILYRYGVLCIIKLVYDGLFDLGLNNPQKIGGKLCSGLHYTVPNLNYKESLKMSEVLKPNKTPDGKELHSMTAPVRHKPEVVDPNIVRVQVYDTAESVERQLKGLKKICLSMIDELSHQSAAFSEVVKENEKLKAELTNNKQPTEVKKDEDS